MASLPAHARLDVMARPSRPATYADIEALPPNVVGEILGGILHVHPRPALPHAVAATGLSGELSPPFQRGRGGPGGWIILHEPELHLIEDVVVPDLAGWRRERAPDLTKACSTVAPDWVCEVLSESTEAVDRAKKMPIFARDAVAHVWLVDPIVQTVEVFRLDGESYRLVGTHCGDAKARIEPFDAIEIEIAALWAR